MQSVIAARASKSFPGCKSLNTAPCSHCPGMHWRPWFDGQRASCMHMLRSAVAFQDSPRDYSTKMSWRSRRNYVLIAKTSWSNNRADCPGTRLRCVAYAYRMHAGHQTMVSSAFPGNGSKVLYSATCSLGSSCLPGPQ